MFTHFFFLSTEALCIFGIFSLIKSACFALLKDTNAKYPKIFTKHTKSKTDHL